MFFVIFDVEALYLFAWSTPHPRKRLGWLCGSAVLFIFVLLAGLAYLARIGALDWTPGAFTPRAYEPGNEQYR